MASQQNIEVLTTVPFPEAVMQQLRGLSPRIRITFNPATKSDEISNDIWQRTEVLYTDILLPDLALVPNLKWVQFHYAGVDFIQGSDLLNRKGLKITSMSGASAIQEGEYILMMLLALGHHMKDITANQEKAEWPADRWTRFSPVELTGSTVGLVGYGSISREVARLLKPFEVRVLAAKRDVMHPEDRGYTVEGHGDPGGDYFDRLYPIEALNSMLKECDFVVVTLPLTPSTNGVIGEEELKAMKPGAFLVHVSRGGVVDEKALLQVLTDKHLAGAAVDVFSHEPLPPDHPLWKAPNLILTPHVSGFSPKYKERAGTMFAENLKRYLRAEPLLNEYQAERHY
jgi:phosphoglycerate dehydrogenase-like enzyme